MQFAKHLYVLQKLSTIPRKDPVPNAPWYASKRAAIMTDDEAIVVWDHLFEYIHANWDVPSTMAMTWWAQRKSDEQKVELYDCRKMLEMGPEDLETRLESLPPYFTESIFPVAVARYLLRDLWIPLNHRKTVTFKEFHNRYGSMILSD